MFAPAPVSSPAPKRRLHRVGKRIHAINQVFASLSPAHKRAEVYLALGRAAGLSEDSLRRHASVALSMIEGVTRG